jgi:hypothetical protein
VRTQKRIWKIDESKVVITKSVDKEINFELQNQIFGKKLNNRKNEKTKRTPLVNF